MVGGEGGAAVENSWRGRVPGKFVIEGLLHNIATQLHGYESDLDTLDIDASCPQRCPTSICRTISANFIPLAHQRACFNT